MDIYCPRCGEPFDMDSLHDEAAARYGIPYYLDGRDLDGFDTKHRQKNPAYDADAYQHFYKAVRADFQTEGCGIALASAFTNGQPCRKQERPADQGAPLTRSEAAAAVYDLLGDDLDGAAAMLEDAELAGWME